MSIFARASAASRVTGQGRRLFTPLMIAAVAVILFSTAGIAAIKGWRSAADGTAKPGDTRESGVVAPTAPTTQTQRRAKARGTGRCAECGLVVSVGEKSHDVESGVNATGVAGRANQVPQSSNLATKHETIVRMADGSSRVIKGMAPANWRVGERVIVIAGKAPAP